MKKVIIVLLALALVASGCSSSKYDESVASDMAMPETMAANEAEKAMAEEKSRAANQNSGIGSAGLGAKGEFDYGNRKVIKRGSMSIETESYQESVDAIYRITKNANGYIEDYRIRGGSDRETDLHRASFVIRVPHDKYDDLLLQMNDIGFVRNNQSGIEDVSDIYFDTESRLKTLRVQEQRLLALLEKAEKIEDVIALEASLSDVLYRIESLTGTLKKYDDLINYSTVTIELFEVKKEEAKNQQKQGFAGKLTKSFQNGLKNTQYALESLLLFVAENFVLIAVIIVVVLLIKKRKMHFKLPFKKKKKDDKQ